MTDCECLPGCIFFNEKMVDNDGLAEIYRLHYCRGDNSQCARHMVFIQLGKASVPADLYPNMVNKADEILSAYMKGDNRIF